MNYSAGKSESADGLGRMGNLNGPCGPAICRLLTFMTFMINYFFFMINNLTFFDRFKIIYNL